MVEKSRLSDWKANKEIATSTNNKHAEQHIGQTRSTAIIEFMVSTGQILINKHARS